MIDIFSKQSRREGLWDTIFIVKVCKWMSELEEVGLTDEEYVPEDRILKVTAMETNTATRSALVRGIQRVRGSKSKALLRETVIRW